MLRYHSRDIGPLHTDMCFCGVSNARLAFLSLMLFAASISSCSDPAPMTLEMRLVESVEAREGEWLPTCAPESLRDFTYTYVAGNSVKVRASETPEIVLPIDMIRNISVGELKSPLEPYLSVFEVRVLADEVIVKAARELRSRCPANEILLTMGGVPVWLEASWTRWRDDLPGGVFASWEEAEEAYSAAPVRIAHVPLDQDEYEEQKAFYQARWTADLWLFVCDERHREEVRLASPDDYAELMARKEIFEAIDCSKKPEEPRSPSD